MFGIREKEKKAPTKKWYREESVGVGPFGGAWFFFSSAAS